MRADHNKWYDSAAWKRRRRHHLRLQSLCEMCRDDGKVVPAACVDHVTPHRGDYELFVLGALVVWIELGG
jgi:hypothetical protein